MRGKGFKIRFVNGKFRITPAYAGKSENGVYPFPKTEDHPRLCGEKRPPPLQSAEWLGSPPPMRGKVTFLIDTVFPARITPAYAGKSLEISLTQQACQDHPRLCGEKTCFFRSLRSDIGSPPPMRGKVTDSIENIFDCRITPAYAGKR